MTNTSPFYTYARNMKVPQTSKCMGVVQYLRVNSPTLNKHSVFHWFIPIGPVYTFCLTCYKENEELSVSQ